MGDTFQDAAVQRAAIDAALGRGATARQHGAQEKQEAD
jgi:hypothetical protein